MQYLPRKILKIQWTGTLSLLSPRGKLDTPVINGVHAPTTSFRYAMMAVLNMKNIHKYRGL